jgi:hypothetical protein
VKTKVCTSLDGKSYELFQLLVHFYDELRLEADRTGIRIDASQISKVIQEGRDLIYAPVHPTRVNRQDDPTESYQNPPFGLAALKVFLLMFVQTLDRLRGATIWLPLLIIGIDCR